MRLFIVTAAVVFAGCRPPLPQVGPTVENRANLPRVCVALDRSGFALEPAGEVSRPWGVNYDHDDAGRLIEDYWIDEWSKVEEDFAQMKKLGANVVRIHLQFGRFMLSPKHPNHEALAQLGKLLAMAEREKLYLDLTGLGCYHKADVPAWYDALDEEGRWDAQARFWITVAEQCRVSPAVFCFDLMNEPVVPGGKRKPGDWLGPPFGGKHFVQFITLDQRDRPRPEVARRWIAKLVAAIRSVDSRHLITVGLVDWSLDRPGLSSGFVPKEIAPELDFLAVHIYPEKGRVDAALETLRGFAVGKPVIVEETFPLKCSGAELDEFMDRAGLLAAGWLSFYWGKPPMELREPRTLVDALTLDWLTRFKGRSARMTGR